MQPKATNRLIGSQLQNRANGELAGWARNDAPQLCAVLFNKGLGTLRVLWIHSKASDFLRADLDEAVLWTGY